jgi:uncharacterized protein (TIGR02271 family)
MDYENTRTVTAFYETRAAADAHKQQLVELGVPANDIAIVDGADANEPNRQYEEKGFFESIGDFFMGEEDRNVYSEGLRRGGYLLTARVAYTQYDQALILLDDDHAVDMDERSNAWRSEGWEAAPAENVAGTPAIGIAEPVLDPALTDDKIEVVEENLRIGKRDVSHGRVRVRSYVVEDQVSEDVALRSEQVEIERRPVDRAVEPGTAAFQDRTIEAEETAQEAVITKEARVVEEIDLKRRAQTDTETVTDTVRRTEVEVEDDRDMVQTDTPMPR